MKVITDFEKFPRIGTNTVLAIGNFDGLHLGHQKILKFLVNIAQKNDLLSLVLTFSPHPEKILKKGRVHMIQTLEQRLEAIKEFNVQAVLVTPFNQQFSSLSSRDFVQEIAIKRLQAKEVVVGENFRFGKKRHGDISLLRKVGREIGLRVHSIPSVKKHGKTVSSSLIRNLLQKGEIEEANEFLGKSYEIRGKVIKGEARGKTIGFPTANIQTENEIAPPGVFITSTRIGSRTYPSLTNIGVRPTFSQKELCIESYIINFNKNLYGEKIRINFLKKIRDEIKFRNPRNLSLQIEKDLQVAKNYFLDFFPEI